MLIVSLNYNNFSDGVVAGSYSCRFDTHHASCDAVLALKTYSNQNRKPEFGLSFGVSVWKVFAVIQGA